MDDSIDDELPPLPPALPEDVMSSDDSESNAQVRPVPTSPPAFDSFYNEKAGTASKQDGVQLSSTSTKVVKMASRPTSPPPTTPEATDTKNLSSPRSLGGSARKWDKMQEKYVQNFLNEGGVPSLELMNVADSEKSKALAKSATTYEVSTEKEKRKVISDTVPGGKKSKGTSANEAKGSTSTGGVAQSSSGGTLPSKFILRASQIPDAAPTAPRTPDKTPYSSQRSLDKSTKLANKKLSASEGSHSYSSKDASRASSPGYSTSSVLVTRASQALEVVWSAVLIIGFETRNESKKDRYVVYALNGTRLNGSKVSSFRRYGDFVKFASVASSEHGIALPLPPKLLLNAHDQTVLAERAAALQAMLQEIITHVELHAMLSDFLLDRDFGYEGGAQPAQPKRKPSMRLVGTLSRRNKTLRATANSTRDSFRQLEELGTASTQKLRDFLTARSETEPLFVGQLYSEANASLWKALVLTSFRVYVLRSDCAKMESEGHVFDIQALESNTNTGALNIMLRGERSISGVLKKGHELFVNALRTLEDKLFPGREREHKIQLKITPKGHRGLLRPTHCGPCGGFVATYRAMLNLLDCTYGDREQDVAFVVDNLFETSGTCYLDWSQFRMGEGNGPLPHELSRAMVMALVHNLYFRGLIIRTPLNKFVFDAICLCLQYNSCFDKLVLSNVTGLNSGSKMSKSEKSEVKAGIQDVLQSLSENPRLYQLCSLDLSNNGSIGSGATSLSVFLARSLELQYFDASRCGLDACAVGSLLTAMDTNRKSVAQHLTHLELGGNVGWLDDGNGPLLTILGDLVSLRHLGIAQSVATSKYERIDMSRTYQSPLSALLRHATPTEDRKRGLISLQSLDMSGNSIDNSDRSVLVEFLVATQSHLEELDLSECVLNDVLLGAVLRSFCGNLCIQSSSLDVSMLRRATSAVEGQRAHVCSLDVSGNALNGIGFESLCQWLVEGSAPCLSSLHANGVFTNSKDAHIAQAVDALVIALNGRHLVGRRDTMGGSPCALHTLTLDRCMRLDDRVLWTRERAVRGVGVPLGDELSPLLVSLGENDSLRTLSLCGHQIGNNGAIVLSQSLQQNDTLCDVRYDGNRTKASGFGALAYAIARNNALERFSTPVLDVASALQSVVKHKKHNRHDEVEQLLCNVRMIEAMLARNIENHRRVIARAQEERDSVFSFLANTSDNEGDDMALGYDFDGGRQVYDVLPGHADRLALAQARNTERVEEPGFGGLPGQRASDKRRLQESADNDSVVVVTPSSGSARRRGNTMRRIALVSNMSQQHLHLQRNRATTHAATGNLRRKGVIGAPLRQVVRTSFGVGGEFKMPAFLSGLLASLEKLHLRETGLFEKPADMQRVQQVLSDIDAGRKVEFATMDSTVLISTLMMFLRSLPEPLFTSLYRTQFLSVISEESQSETDCADSIRRVIRRLPSVNVYVLRSLFVLLAKIVHEKESNGTSVHMLGVAFAPVLLFSDKSEAIRLIEFLIAHHELVFTVDETPAALSALARSDAGLQAVARARARVSYLPLESKPEEE